MCAPADAGVLADSIMSPGALRGRTVRNVAHLSAGGRAIRVRVSNALGTDMLLLEEVDIGISQSGASVVRGSNHPVLFNGARHVAIPAGAVALSDPVALAVTSGQNIAVSIFLGGGGGAPTVHRSAFQNNFITGAGNFAAREDAAAYTAVTRSWFFLSGIDLLAADGVKGAIIALGDSITDGDGSSIGGNRRWPDVLSQHLALQPGGMPLSVINAGISGNRVLGNSPCFGIGLLARLNRDVFSQTEVRAVILMEGINDILHPDYHAAHKSDRVSPCVDAPQAGAEDLIAAYQQIAAQAHAKGLKIYVGTITPYQGFVAWTQSGEAKRQAVNRWIKSGNNLDGAIDFAAAIADARNPARIAPAKDSGDHVHPNDSGYAAMAAAIDLAMLRRDLR